MKNIIVQVIQYTTDAHLSTSSDQRVMKNIIVQFAQMIRTAQLIENIFIFFIGYNFVISNDKM